MGVSVFEKAKSFPVKRYYNESSSDMAIVATQLNIFHTEAMF